MFVGWNVMTLLGAVMGNQIGDPKAYGLDAAAVAAFCALLWPRLRTRQARAVAVAAAAIALLVAPHTAAGVPVLAATVAAVVAGLLPQRRSTGGSRGPSRPAQESSR